MRSLLQWLMVPWLGSCSSNVGRDTRGCQPLITDDRSAPGVDHGAPRTRGPAPCCHEPDLASSMRRLLATWPSRTRRSADACSGSPVGAKDRVISTVDPEPARHKRALVTSHAAVTRTRSAPRPRQPVTPPTVLAEELIADLLARCARPGQAEMPEQSAAAEVSAAEDDEPVISGSPSRQPRRRPSPTRAMRRDEEPRRSTRQRLRTASSKPARPSRIDSRAAANAYRAGGLFTKDRSARRPRLTRYLPAGTPRRSAAP